jgi:hypothetical protein
MAITQPFFRTWRPFAGGPFGRSVDGRAYVEDNQFAKEGEHYVRALMLIQQDLLSLFDFIEPDDKNKQTYSYRTHALHMRAAIEVEANCKAILAENGFVKLDKHRKPTDHWTMNDYKLLERTHRLSQYEIMLPVWKGPANTEIRQPFAQWSTGKTPPWWSAYNEAKHDRHEKFAEANFTNLIDAVCALVVILSAQFYRHDFSPGPGLIAWGSSAPVGYDTAIGEYFWVKFPTWPADEQYDFEWNSTTMTFQQHKF